MGRLIYLSLAYLFFALGVVGAFLPVLPTTPFLLLAVWCGAKGSTRFKWWLLRHPRYGPGLRLWYRQGAIPRRGKLIAVAVIASSWLLIYAKGSSTELLLITGFILSCSALFVATRPDPH
ncbi:MAG: YbaN family protein [Cellvibrionaceae bacterium]|nr:YbaN family protein [Cellvibrionaceae bacterium]